MTQPKDDVQYSLCRLLVVDDNPRLLFSLSEQLINAGFEVSTAESGKAALQQVQHERFDLMLLDLHMPGLNGLQLMSRMSRADLNIPVVVISGLSSFGTVRRAFRSGAYDYVRKPYAVDELVTTLHKALQKSRIEQTRIAVQKCLETSGTFYRRALDNLPQIVFALDDQGRFCFINNKITHLLGYQESDVLGQPFTLIVKSRETKSSMTFDGALKNLAGSETHRVCLKIRDNPNVNRYFDITLFPLAIEPDSNPRSFTSCFPAHILGIAQDITEQKDAEAFLTFRASHDLLTRLPNRILFRDRLELAMAHASRNDTRFAVMFLDLNRFKEVNDKLGHSVGDRVIQEIAQRFKSCVRAEDTLARYGGDEFVLVLPAADSEHSAEVIAKKLIQSLRVPFSIDRREVHVGVSIGIAMYPDSGQSFDEVMQCADGAMYLAKSRGEDGYQFYGPARG